MSNVENFPEGDIAPRNRAERRAAQRGQGRGRRVAGAALTAGSAAFAATAALAGPAAAPAGAAATLQVTTNADSGAGSLRDQVAAASSGDTIAFDVTGTITLTTGEIAFNKDLTIMGPGAGALTLSGNDNSRIFHVTGTSSVTVSGLTLIDGASTSDDIGGGAIASEGPLTLADDVFHDNHAEFGGSSGDDGGAVYVDAATTISNTTFANNVAGDWGGAVIATSVNSNVPAPVTVTGSTFTGNQGAGHGGGLSVEDMTIASVSGSTFTGNTTSEGGGVAFDGATYVSVSDSTVSGNEATSGTGGGIHAEGIDGKVVISSTTVAGNTSRDEGGGIFVDSISGTLALNGASVTGNTAADSGGGVYAYELYGGVQVTNSAISGNTADGWGGGLYLGATYQFVTVANTTISNNTATSGGGGVQLSGNSNEQTVTVTNTTISGNQSDIGGGGGWIQWAAGGPTTFANSTISGNTTTGQGGGLYFYGFYGLNVDMTTVTGNTSTQSTGGIFLYGGEQVASAGSGGHHGHDASAAAADTNSAGGSDPGHGARHGEKAHAAAVVGDVDITGSIVWGNSGNDVGELGNVTFSHSLLGTIAAGIVQTDAGGNLTGVDPLLGPLQNNGGATETHELLTGSPAIDAGPDPVPDFPGNEFDQRGEGFARVVGTKSDIGAFEVQPPAAAPESILITPKFTG